jgi:hypothetical protein
VAQLSTRVGPLNQFGDLDQQLEMVAGLATFCIGLRHVAATSDKPISSMR